MSGYLTRMVTRTRGAGEVQSLKPIVRSASPIAEHDQRIGMPGFEGVEFGGPSLIDAGPDAASGERRDTLQLSASSAITRASGTSEPNVRRKVVNASAASTGQMKNKQMAQSSLGHSDAPLPSGVPGVTHQTRQFASRASDTGAAALAESLHDPVKSLDLPVAEQPQKPVVESSSIAAEKQLDVDLEEAISPTKQVPTEISTGEPGQPDGPLRQVDRGSVHVRSGWQSHQADAPCLEPSPRIIAEEVGPTSAAADTPLSDHDEGPRVVIERVHVEVVAPFETQPSTAPAPGPLTAASVSVIGPLGGGVPTSQRLSLRYR